MAGGSGAIGWPAPNRRRVAQRARVANPEQQFDNRPEAPPRSRGPTLLMPMPNEIVAHSTCGERAKNFTGRGLGNSRAAAQVGLNGSASAARTCTAPALHATCAAWRAPGSMSAW